MNFGVFILTENLYFWDMMTSKLKVLGEGMQGKLYFDATMRKIYATDASSYREMPLAVAIPKTKEDLK